MKAPVPPENVRAVMADGTVIPLDLVYKGVEERGSERGLHVWETVTRLSEPPARIQADVLPARTTIRVPMVKPRWRS